MAENSDFTIVVIGGVAGGASAATRARRCNENARIIIFERDDHVSFANCGLPYYIGGEIEDREKLLVAKPELFRDRFRIDVHTRHEVTQIDPAAKTVTVRDLDAGTESVQNWDRLILTPGASPIVPPIEGIDAANVFVLRNLADTDAIKQFVATHQPQRAVVVGAGFIGLEMVEQLQRIGIKTDLVELQEQVLPPLDAEMAHLVEEELAAHDVSLHLGDGIAGLDVEGENATAVELNSGTKLPADLVILGIGVRPNVELAKQAGLDLGPTGGITVNEFLQTSHADIYAAGDAIEYHHGVLDQPMRIPLAGPANRAGRIAGEHAATGKSAPMAPPMGTAIVRVFGITAALTGLTTEFGNRMQRPSRSVLVAPKHHAGYFPGAETLTLKLTYDPDSERVLGAQAVGRAGIDKRIDVIATALHFQGTIRDLAGLDLAYAPPFGSAKDPVHMAAFVACNDLDSVTAITEVDADLSGKQIVDVRSAAELAQFRLPEIKHIPLHELRDRLGELDPTAPTVTLCHSGMRAHIAARILKQHGFPNVSNLTGGMHMRQHATPGDVLRGEG